MCDQVCRRPCWDDPRCWHCDQLWHAVAPCIECRDRGIHHFVNMLDELSGQKECLS